MQHTLKAFIVINLRCMLIKAFIAFLLFNGSVPILAKADGGKKKEGAEAAPGFDPKKMYEKTNDYVSAWLKFPPVSGTVIMNDDLNAKFNVTKGEIPVVIFLASWCVPCQNLSPLLVRLQRKYEPLGARFTYVFTSDTEDDARQYYQEYQLSGLAMLANLETKKTFRNPELPSLYIGDRRGWLLTRHIKFKREDLQKIEVLLELLTAN